MQWAISILLLMEWRECSTKVASYCCSCKAVSNNYFQNILLINFITSYPVCLKSFSFAHFLVIEGNGKYSLQKESVITPFIEWFKTATLRKSSWCILLVLTTTCLNLLALLTFSWKEAVYKVFYERIQLLPKSSLKELPWKSQIEKFNFIHSNLLKALANTLRMMLYERSWLLLLSYSGLKQLPWENLRHNFPLVLRKISSIVSFLQTFCY